MPTRSNQESSGSNSAPLRVVSLGNARDEKGILELVQAIRIIEAAGKADRFHFELQVNDPAPDIADAIEVFASEKRSNVTLHRKALGTEPYYELLARADLVALPYWSSIYEARTSGVFLEAVAAAKPVVCTDDTWMSDELAKAGAGLLVKSADAADLARQLLNAEELRSELATKALADVGRIREAFNATTALRAVLGKEEARTIAPDRWNAAVLYPWGDALLSHSGASLRTNLLARYLAENGASVRLLQNSQDRSELRGAIRFESYHIDPRLGSSKGDKNLRWLTKHVLGAKEDADLFMRMFRHPEWDAAFANRLNEIIRWADVVFLEYSFWGPLVARLCREHRKPMILTTYDVLSNQIREQPLRLLTRRMEIRAMKAAPHRYTVSAEDRAVFEKMGVSTETIPHPIDVASMRIPPPADTRKLLAKLLDVPEDTEHYFLFVGSAYGPNIAAANSVKAIAELYAEKHPNDKVQFIVAGGCHQAARVGRNFAALGRVDDLTLRLLYEHLSAALIPLRHGTGASLKTIEAFGAGRTAIGTAFAFRGLDVANDVECLIAESDEDLVEAVASVTRDKELLLRLTAAAAKAGEKVDFHRIFSAYEKHIPQGRRTHSEQAVARPAHTRRIGHFIEVSRAARRCGMPDVAKRYLEEVIRLEPQNGGAILAAAQLAGDSGELEECLRLLDTALVSGAPEIDTMRARIEVCRAAGKDVSVDLWRIGRMFLSQTWSREPSNRSRAQIWRDFEAGERQWLVDLLGPVLEHRPDLPDAGYWFLHAHSLLDVGGDAELAAQHFKRAVELGFDQFWGNFHLSRVLDRLSQVEDSMAALLGAARAARGKNADLLHGPVADRLWWLFYAGRYEDGVTFARSLLKVGFSTPVVQYLLGECLKNSDGSKEEALAAFEAASEGGHQLFWVHMNRAALLGSMGKHDQARRDYLKAYEAASDEGSRELASTHAGPMIQADYNAKRYAAVEETCRALLKGWNGNAFAHFMLAEALTISNRSHVEAAKHYALATEAGYDKFWGYYHRSQAHAKAGLAAESLNDLVEAAKNTQNFGDCDRLAPLLAQETHSAFAARDYARVVQAASGWCRVQPNSGEAHYLLAEALLILNEDLDTAEQHYNLAMIAGHNEYWVSFNRAQLFRRTGRYQDATGDLHRALELAVRENRSNETASAACDLAVELVRDGMLLQARELLEAAHTTSASSRAREMLKSLGGTLGDKVTTSQLSA